MIILFLFVYKSQTLQAPFPRSLPCEEKRKGKGFVEMEKDWPKS